MKNKVISVFKVFFRSLFLFAALMLPFVAWNMLFYYASRYYPYLTPAAAVSIIPMGAAISYFLESTFFIEGDLYNDDDDETDNEDSSNTAAISGSINNSQSGSSL